MLAVRKVYLLGDLFYISLISLHFFFFLLPLSVWKVCSLVVDVLFFFFLLSFLYSFHSLPFFLLFLSVVSLRFPFFFFLFLFPFSFSFLFVIYRSFWPELFRFVFPCDNLWTNWQLLISTSQNYSSQRDHKNEFQLKNLPACISQKLSFSTRPFKRIFLFEPSSKRHTPYEVLLREVCEILLPSFHGIS